MSHEKLVALLHFLAASSKILLRTAEELESYGLTADAAMLRALARDHTSHMIALANSLEPGGGVVEIVHKRTDDPR